MRIPGLRLDADQGSLPWVPTRIPGVHWIPLHLSGGAGAAGPGSEQGGSARRGGATVLIRMDPGRGYGRHRHVGSEDVLVLAGGYRDELGEYRQGDCVHYPAGSSHAPVALGDRTRPIGPENPSCVLFAVAPLGIELL